MGINHRNMRFLQFGVFILVAIVLLGIGYAAISNILLTVNSTKTVVKINQENFKVHFTEAQNITGTDGVSGSTIIEDDDTVASFSVTGLAKTGDYAEAKYTVSNDSNGIGAIISSELSNTNTEYFKVTETINDNKLQAGETTTVTVKVEMVKTPLTDSVSTNITTKLKANPLENNNS